MHISYCRAIDVVCEQKQSCAEITLADLPPISGRGSERVSDVASHQITFSVEHSLYSLPTYI